MLHPTENAPKGEKRLLSVTEAAIQLGISRSHLYTLQKAGVIRFSKLLGRTVVTQAELDRVVASLETEAA